MPVEKIIISDTIRVGSDVYLREGTRGKRFYGQKDVPGKPNMCRTTLWTSEFHSPAKYLGTFELEKKARKNQDRKKYSIPPTKTAFSVQATKVGDDVELKKWVLSVYIWIPAGLILSLGVAALITVLIWV